MPVVEIRPPVTARPCSAAARFNSPQITPPSAVAVALSGSIAIPFISARSIIGPPSVTARPATLWPPPRIETSSPAWRGDGQSRNDVVLRPAADDQGGPAVDEPVVQGASIVVLRVLRPRTGPETCSASSVASLESKDVLTSSPFAIWQDGRAAA